MLSALQSLIFYTFLFLIFSSYFAYQLQHMRQTNRATLVRYAMAGHIILQFSASKADAVSPGRIKAELGKDRDAAGGRGRAELATSDE